jgi:hypothetical protein
MKYKVHWLIDGLIEVEAADTETAEKLITEKIETFVSGMQPFLKMLVPKLYKVKHIYLERTNN